MVQDSSNSRYPQPESAWCSCQWGRIAYLSPRIHHRHKIVVANLSMLCTLRRNYNILFSFSFCVFSFLLLNPCSGSPFAIISGRSKFLAYLTDRVIFELNAAERVGRLTETDPLKYYIHYIDGRFHKLAFGYLKMQREREGKKRIARLRKLMSQPRFKRLSK